MDRIGRFAGAVFGIVMIALSVMTTIETVVRKLFSVSLGGVDELSGYAIAIGAPLAFTVAAIEQSHIRINLLYMKAPQAVQAALNLLSALAVAGLAAFFLIFSFRTLRETVDYRAIAQTPWATPLVYPQSVWLAAMAAFALVAAWIAVKAARQLARGATAALARDYGPERVEEELEAELEDLGKREGA